MIDYHDKTKDELIKVLDELLKENNALKTGYAGGNAQISLAINVLAESEDKYRFLFTHNPQPIFIYDLETLEFLEVNKAMISHYGYSGEEFLSMTLQDLHLLEDIPDFLKDIELARTAFNPTGEWRNVKKNGEIVFVEIAAFSLGFNDRKARHVLVHDITDQISAERESRQAVENLLNERLLLRTLIDNIPDSIYSKDLACRKTLVNKAELGFMGAKSESEVLGKDDFDFYPLELADKFFADDQSVIQSGKAVLNREEYVLDENGQKRWLLSSKLPLCDKDDKVIGLVGIGRDITDRKIAEENLKENEERHRTILQTAMDGFWLTDLQGNLLEVNQTYCRMSGYSEQELLTMKIADLMAPERVSVTEVLLQKIIEKGEERYESRHRSKDGVLFDVEVSIQYQPAEGGRFVSFFHDISKRKRDERDLRIAKEQAEESDKLKSAFLANMSHEIRTPMNGILGFTELLKMPGLSGEDQQEYIGIIKKSGERMLNIINDIVDISKIEAGQMDVFISETNINEQLEYVYIFFKPEVEAKGMQLSIKNGLTAEKAVIHTDREKLYAVLTNLVKNAIKYSDAGSIEFGYTLKPFVPSSNHAAVELSAHAAVQSSVHAVAQSSAHAVVQSSDSESMQQELVFYVKDSGIGIPQSRQKAIFDRFVQADISDARAFEGAGLGLSISKAYLEMLGGTIWVESEAGVGSTFYFSIPYQPKLQLSKVADIPETIGKHEINDLKILVAEDDEASAMLISMAMKSFSKQVLRVRNGLAVVESCRNNPDIDLVLMDIKMPGMDGYEATSKIREFNKKVFIIAQTAFGLSDDRDKALAAGCNDYVSKPLDIALLKSKILFHFTK
ncbi:MAG: PAS domain S-box protein [Bacteroidota bacterium]